MSLVSAVREGRLTKREALRSARSGDLQSNTNTSNTGSAPRQREGKRQPEMEYLSRTENAYIMTDSPKQLRSAGEGHASLSCLGSDFKLRISDPLHTSTSVLDTYIHCEKMRGCV